MNKPNGKRETRGRPRTRPVPVRMTAEERNTVQIFLEARYKWLQKNLDVLNEITLVVAKEWVDEQRADTCKRLSAVAYLLSTVTQPVFYLDPATGLPI